MGFFFFSFFFPHAPDMPKSVLRKTQLPTQARSPSASPPGFRAPLRSLMFRHAVQCSATLGEAPSRYIPRNSIALLVLLQRPAIARRRARNKELEDTARNRAHPPKLGIACSGKLCPTPSRSSCSCAFFSSPCSSYFWCSLLDTPLPCSLLVFLVALLPCSFLALLIAPLPYSLLVLLVLLVTPLTYSLSVLLVTLLPCSLL